MLTVADYRRMRSVFHAALEVHTADRMELVGDRLPDRADLRQEVESLLAEHEEDPQFLEFAGMSDEEGRSLHVRILEEAESESKCRAPSFQIPGFRIVRLLGEGGFARVWLAEQTHPVVREVAIKVLRPGCDTRRVMERFHNERQTLARMNHPEIASILEAGTLDEGMPYFVMELFCGSPLTDFAREQGLDLKQRIRLLARVCDAIQHAHGRGVLHRDLKPSNVLASAGEEIGQVRVIDFGIARILDDVATPRTREGTLVGTIAYASPEQLSLDPQSVDVRTDVYALGVLLHELLCGELPHTIDGLSPAAAARLITDHDPIPVGRRDRSLRGDLESIVTRALARRACDRYPTVSELAADLRCFLADQPVTARRPSLTYHLRLFARRHRAATIAALVVTIAVFGSMIWVIQNRQHQQRLLRTTEASLGLALDMVTEDLYRRAGTRSERLQRLEKALELIAPHVHVDSRNPELLTEYVRIQEALGSLLVEAGEAAAARPYAIRSLELRKQLAALRPASVMEARSLSVALIKRGDLENVHPTRQDALKFFDEAHALLEQLHDRDPIHRGVRDDLCWSYLRRAQIWGYFGDTEATREGYAMARDLATELVGSDPESLSARWSLLSVLRHEIDLLHDHGSISDLTDLVRDSVVQARFLVSKEPEDRTYRICLLGALIAQARMDRAMGRPQESLLTLKSAIPQAKALAREDGGSIHINQLHQVHCNTASSALLGEEFELARFHAQRSLRVAEEGAKRSPDSSLVWTWFVRSHGCIAVLAGKIGDLALHRKHARAFVDLHEERLKTGLTDDETLDLSNFLAKCVDLDIRDPDRAVSLARSVVESGQRSAHALQVLAIAVDATGDRVGATRLLEEAREACPAGGLREAEIDELLASFATADPAH